MPWLWMQRPRTPRLWAPWLWTPTSLPRTSLARVLALCALDDEGIPRPTYTFPLGLVAPAVDHSSTSCLHIAFMPRPNAIRDLGLSGRPRRYRTMVFGVGHPPQLDTYGRPSKCLVKQPGQMWGGVIPPPYHCVHWLAQIIYYSTVKCENGFHELVYVEGGKPSV